MKEYELSSEEILAKVQGTPDGISGEEAQKRLEQYGENKLKEAQKATLLQRFLAQLKDPMLIILMVAAGVSAVTSFLQQESPADVIIILIVVLLNAILGVYQESKQRRPLRHYRP